jgi:hypothetical protein
MAIRSPVSRIDVRVQVGDSLLAASDDPFFLGLRGACGREFRLLLAQGKSLRRKALDHYVLAPVAHADTNVKFPELNDPTAPALDPEAIQGVYLRKGLDPIPNVRAVGEMDDRLEIVEASVEIHSEAGTKRYQRAGPLWLGLNAGLTLDLARLDAS